MFLVRWRKISFWSSSASYWSMRAGHLVAELAHLLARSRAGCPRSRRRPGSSACASAGRPTSRTGRGSVSRSRKQYQNIEIAPRSSAEVPSQTRCEWIRFSSMWMHPQVLGARRGSRARAAARRAAEGLHVEEVGEVVHPLHERDDLPVALLLAGLLDPGVDVADRPASGRGPPRPGGVTISRSTPWVAGWCGPMLIVISSCSGSRSPSMSGGSPLDRGAGARPALRSGPRSRLDAALGDDGLLVAELVVGVVVASLVPARDVDLVVR